MIPIPTYPAPNQTPPEPPSPNYHFRWKIFILIPLIIAAVLFVLNGIEPSFQIKDLLDWLGVVKQNRYTRMMCLMVASIAVLLAVKLFQKKED